MSEMNILILISILAYFLLFSKELHSAFVYSCISCLLVYTFRDDISQYLTTKQDYLFERFHTNNLSTIMFPENSNKLPKTDTELRKKQNVKNIPHEEIKDILVEIYKSTKKYKLRHILVHLNNTLYKIIKSIRRPDFNDKSFLSHQLNILEDLFNEIILNTPVKLHRRILRYQQNIINLMNEAFSQNKSIDHLTIVNTVMSAWNK